MQISYDISPIFTHFCRIKRKRKKKTGNPSQELKLPVSI